ncbi:hypothetical protein EV368DRAFT_68641 [Lentinula lateritia]|nr:hypothetical protein EV368DRAFT_68641 [Lentinula lateritia]
MDAQPRFTRSRARVAPPGDVDPAPRPPLSLRQSILGPPPGNGVEAPATPPPTFVQPAWIIPRPNGEDALRAREAIRASRSRTQASTPAGSPLHSPPTRNAPVARVSRPSSTALGSPMVQDPGHSDDEWFGVAGSDLYDPNDAYATSGEEGSAPAYHSRSRSVSSSPSDTDFRRDPVELSPSVALEDFLRTADAGPLLVLSETPLLLRYLKYQTADPSSNLPPGSTQVIAPPQISAGAVTTFKLTASRGLAPVLGKFLLGLTSVPTFVAPHAHSLQLRTMLRLGSIDPPCEWVGDLQFAEQRVPVKNGRRFRDPRQGEISSSVLAAMLNQVNPLVISALRSGWPAFISLNYFSRPWFLQLARLGM